MGPVNAAEIAAQNGVSIFTVGVGDPTGSGEERVDLEGLSDIASRAGGQFFFADDEAGLASVYAEIDAMTPRAVEVLSHRPRVSLGHLPLSAAALLALATTAWLQLSAHQGRARA